MTDLEQSGEKLRRAAERRARKRDGGERRRSDTEAAEAHSEVVDPAHSKGRPQPDPAKDEPNGASNAGTDGP
jgi:hypothetical protein